MACSALIVLEITLRGVPDHAWHLDWKASLIPVQPLEERKSKAVSESSPHLLHCPAHCTLQPGRSETPSCTFRRRMNSQTQSDSVETSWGFQSITSYVCVEPFGLRLVSSATRSRRTASSPPDLRTSKSKVARNEALGKAKLLTSDKAVLQDTCGGGFWGS